MTPTRKLEAVVPPTDDDGAELWATFYTFRIEADGSASFPFVSHTCAELFGFSAQEAMRDVSLMHDAVHPDDRRRFDEDGRRSLRDLQLLRWRGRIVRRDGSTCPVRVTSRPARLPDGATEWHGVVVEDPASRGDAHHGPDGAVAVRQADALAMLGHDVAAPLTAILACAELALEEVNRERRQPPRDINAAAVRRCLEVVVRQSHRLEAIRGDLLILAAADLASADVTVSVDCPAGLCCTVQPSHLSQMLSNLVANAVRHARREVVLSASRVGERVLVTVTDDGPGVPAEVVPSLFTRFSHTGAAVRPAGAGTGLGLYIVRVLARANHGTVVHTPTDSGARFTLALPAA